MGGPSPSPSPSGGSCLWANKCINSEGQCRACNKSPWYDTDGNRCVCGPGAADWIHKGECKACSLEAQAQDACPWATKCTNSEGQCQACNKSPWYDTDGNRCVCGPGAADWIHKGECK